MESHDLRHYSLGALPMIKEWRLPCLKLKFKTRVQDIQRHPIRPELQHIDLLFVD